MGKKRGSQRPNTYVGQEGRTNELFEEYYRKTLNLSEEEWNSFLATIVSDLPTTFRVTGFREHSKEVQWLLQNQFIENMISGNNTNGDTKSIVSNMSWYPGQMAWQLNATKLEIRRTPELRKLHQFLVSETNCGFISRQEAVSMIPPLLLDVKPHHKVLDLCAAPGSKTAQLIEMLHAGVEGIPSGVVVANDIDNKRCYMMVHQLQRLQSPCSVVVRQDASIFPRMFIRDETSKTGSSPMLFDRILVDVPCSGDGTLRKNPTIWTRWTPYLGVNEHFLQQKILKRALEMLAVGGRLVYSTCSLNPSENEAVVASILTQTAGTTKLLNVAEILPNLKGKPGLSNWSLMMRDKTWCKELSEVPVENKRSLRASLFPPKGIESLNMHYCMRVLPHQQNTGGFFLAVIEKTECLPWMNAARPNTNPSPSDIKVETTVTENISPVENALVINDAAQKEGPPKKKMRIFKEDPFYYVNETDIVWPKIKEFYDISHEFPDSQLMYRNNEGKRRNFYFTNDLVKQLVQCNEERGSVNFVNLGVKVFGFSEDKQFQGYRLLQEGMEIVAPFVGSVRRRLTIPTRDDLIKMFNFDYPLVTEFSTELQQSFAKLTLGPVVFQYFPDGNEVMPRIPVVFAGWRGNSSVRSYVGGFERCHMLRVCGEEPEPLLEAARKVTVTDPALEESDEEAMAAEPQDSVMA